LQLKAIESALKLYAERNVTRASAELFITQQGLSRQLRALEEELGVVLFERSRSGLVPTAICERLMPRFKAMQEEYLAAKREIEAHSRGRGRPALPVAFAIGLSHCLDTDFIFDYQKSRREAGIAIEEWSQPACVKKLLSGELELAFLVDPFDRRLVKGIPLAEDYMFAALHRDHPLAASDKPMPFALLDGEDIITGAPDNALRGLFDHFCALTGIKPRIIVSSSYSLNFANAMREDAGIVTVTSRMAASLANPDLVVRRLLTPKPGLMYLCHAAKAPASRERSALIRYVKDYFDATPMARFKED